MKKIKAYKAFDKDLKCRGFKFEIGKSYHEKKVSVCESGFHSCENPFDVLNYYNLTECRFAEVDVFGKIEKHKDDSKIASSDITIVRELTLSEFISVVWDYIYNNNKDGAASGDWSKLAASGDWSQLAASGNESKLAASGDWSKLAASGDMAQLAASGDRAKLEITGQNSVAANIGVNGKIKAAKGTWITLAEYDDNYICVCVKSAKVDGELIKADTWYMLKNGEFTEC